MAERGEIKGNISVGEKCGFRVSAYFYYITEKQPTTMRNQGVSRVFRAESAPPRKTRGIDKYRVTQLVIPRSANLTFRAESAGNGGVARPIVGAGRKGL
jgi:hypothetical protein